jgi:hypothetical protein
MSEKLSVIAVSCFEILVVAGSVGCHCREFGIFSNNLVDIW